MGKSLLAKLGGVVVAIIVAVIFVVVRNEGTEKIEEAKAPKVGECVNMTGSSFDADHEELKCSDPKATYEIVSDKGNCDDAELNYTISVGSKNSGNVADLCLALNASEGDCFNLGGISSPAKKIACTEATSVDAKILSVGKAGDACADGAQPLENVTRKTVLCLGPAA